MLQVVDVAGNTIVDTNTAVALIVGEAVIGGPGSPKSGTITDPRLALGDPFIVVISGGLALSGGAPNNLPAFSFSGGTLTWSYADLNASPDSRVQSRFLYGVR
ncbi:hypothetical protein GGR88_001328 [Sphingomonas jejuensis]|uniref:Uncharacterized protein n=1 Tax=Sphingomonas jejuensis TaxID=904715 RepID=A0ABX0XKI5_9SPHN|nr:hypothetical protein [Sphingomonas jejuensis]NJC33854.1 hypothetical protein [Sphingomonas jejuensis]